jgi:N-acetylglutamate synthase-like GNAT family acetyltransferase
MLIDVSAKVQEASIKELLEYAVFADPDALQEVMGLYAKTDHILYALEDQEEYVAIIGVIPAKEGIMEMKHLVVRPDERLKGYGRGIIVELLLQEKPAVLEAITDDTTVDFFRNLGFQIIDFVDESGREYYKCIYDAENEED